MAFEQETLREFLGELASESPAPGGGTVAALAGALGSALISMVASLTNSSEKHRDRWETMSGVLRESERLRERLTGLMDEDAEAFNSYIAALRMPKAADSEKEARIAAIAAASRRITEIPLAVISLCAEVTALASKAADFGNPNAASDAGGAALMAEAAGRAAAYNVRINLPSLKDETFAGKVRKELRAGLDAIDKNSREVEKKMDEMLGR